MGMEFERKMVMNANNKLSALLFTSLWLGTLASGCASDFDPPSLVERTRVLGARVEVAGEPQRATPRPGETATVTWLVTAPAETPPLGWAFQVCLPTTTATPCSPAPLAMIQGSDTPSFPIVVPTAEVLGDADHLVVLGLICDGGAPVFDGQRPGCPGAGTQVSFDLAVPRDQPNHNPDVSDRPLWFDGVPWVADESDCALLPQVTPASKDHVVRLHILAADREDTATGRETLQISNFDTAGELNRSFLFVEADRPAADTDIEVKWDAPEVSPLDGRVRFTFVLRDLRGGLAWITRTACMN
jgi:hypothetical protein